MKMIGMYTAAGAQLAARALAEGKALTVTHAAAGSALTDPQATVMAAREQVLTIHSKTAQDTGCTVAAVLNAADADASYTLREVALFASLAGEDAPSMNDIPVSAGMGGNMGSMSFEERPIRPRI